MKALGGMEVEPHAFHDLGTRMRWLVGTTLWPPITPGKTRYQNKKRHVTETRALVMMIITLTVVLLEQGQWSPAARSLGATVPAFVTQHHDSSHYARGSTRLGRVIAVAVLLTIRNERANVLAKQAAASDLEKCPMSYVKKRLKERVINEWNDYWVRSTKGALTRELYFPTIYDTVNSKLMQPNFVLTQFLSGHGKFGSYFERFNVETESVNICACDDSLQRVKHLLFECHKFELQRLELVCRLDRDWINLAQDRDRLRVYVRDPGISKAICLGSEQAKVWGLPEQSSDPEISASGVHAHCGENLLVCHRALTTSVVFANITHNPARTYFLITSEPTFFPAETDTEAQERPFEDSTNRTTLGNRLLSVGIQASSYIYLNVLHECSPEKCQFILAIWTEVKRYIDMSYLYVMIKEKRSQHVLEVSSLGVQTQLNTALHIPEDGSQNVRRQPGSRSGCCPINSARVFFHHVHTHFERLNRKNSGVVKSGDLGGLSPFEMILSGKDDSFSSILAAEA
ncbi:hypothetical protein ANN_04144 [Periplaneta americana]|uniref:Reverse transcriptase n=1 Tax=Periplaneta americana TaxID=6978 RepID=A0ABQ8T7R7_PERAM|nr:hypothetical protein ANN_04144 [Periplaneta americana]